MDKNKLRQELAKALKSEMSGTGTGASVTAGDGMGVATKYAFKKKVKEDAPQLAAGKVKDNYAVSHFGFKDAPSIANRKSDAIDYKKIFEGELKLGVKYDYKGDSGFISTNGSSDPKNWKFLGDKGKYPYLAVKADLVPSKEQPGKYDGAFDYRTGGHLDEIDINDPVLMAMRAKKTAPAPQISKPNRVQDSIKSTISILLKKRAEIERDMEQEAEPEGGPIADKYGDMLNKIDKTIAKLKGQGEWGPETNPYMSKADIEKRAAMMNEMNTAIEPEEQGAGTYDSLKIALKQLGAEEDSIKVLVKAVEMGALKPSDAITITKKALGVKEDIQEGYARFRNETKTRTKPEQFHNAVRQVKQKVNEINRLFEYMNRLQSELSESEGGLKYKKYTEKSIQQIKESTKSLFFKSTKLK